MIPSAQQVIRLTVLGVWLGMSIYIAVNVARRVVDLPVQDDFAFVEQITGDTPVSLAWLWEPHNEHRLPLVKLAIVAVTRAFGIDFRAVPFLSVVLLVGASLACVLTLARHRGRFSLADAMVPVLVCTWAQSETLIWTTTLQLAASTAFALLWWCAARASDASLRAIPICLAGASAVVAASCGGSGIALLAGVVPWFAWTARRSRGRARIAAAAFGAGLGIFAAVYLLSYTRVEGHPVPAGLAVSLRFGLRLTASAWSTIADILDPLGGALMVLFAWMSWRLARSRTTESASSIGLLVGTMAVIAAVVIGRAGFGIDLVSSRYVTLVTPLAVATLALLGEPAVGGLRRDVCVVLCAVSLLSFSAADKQGHWIAGSVQKRLKAARADLLAGRPDAEVIIAHQLFPGVDYAAPRLEMLRRVGGSVFRDQGVLR